MSKTEKGMTEDMRSHRIKSAKEVGWEPETDFETGIRKTIKWYLKNLDWMENITSGEYQNYYKEMYHL